MQMAHFGLNFLMFLGFYLYYLMFLHTPITPSWNLLWFPFVILQCAAIGLAIGLWIAGLSTKYKDLKFAIPFITQIWMYGTPIVYPASQVTNPTLKRIFWMNPMCAPVELSRNLLTGAGSVTAENILISASMTLILLFSGIFIFNKVQRTFVDTI